MARLKAQKVLDSVFYRGAFSNIALDNALKDSSLDFRDRALASKLVYGVIQNLSFIDYQIQANSKLPIKKITPSILNILRLSIYQLAFLDKIPQSAAVNEGVKLAKKAAFSSAGFVNAVLRSYLRRGTVLPDAGDRMKYLEVRYSYPSWLISIWIRDYGEEACEKLLASGNEEPPVTIRVNRLKTTVDELKKHIDAADGPCKWSLNLKTPGAVTEIYGFNEGLFTVQDGAAQMAVDILAPKPGETVLDACAAPGGKTTHIGEIMNNRGRIIAWDKHSGKINLINSAAKRLGITNIETSCADAGEENRALYNTFDKILVDAPCSGLGIIRKKPDIKWSRREEDIPALAGEQLRILKAVANYLKPGGRLVYCTCTLSKEENERTVERFLGERSDFRIENEALTLFPGKTDGFYICPLVRR